MAERDGGGGAPDADLSHDPRTWLRLKPEGKADAASAAPEPAAPSPAPSDASDSFDPSTWAKPATAFRPKPEAEAPSAREKKQKKGKAVAADVAPSEPPAAVAEGPSESFDPSTWAKPATAFRPQPVGAAEPEEAAEPAAAVARREGGPPRALLIGGAAALVLAFAGGAAWFLSRPASEPQEATPAPQAAQVEAPVVIPAGAERSVMTLAGASGLVAALTAQGVAPAQAQAAADAAVKALGPSTGELRVDVSLMRSGAAVTLAALQIRRSDGSGADVVPAGQGFAGKTVAVNTRSEIKVARGQMDAESFWTSAVAAGLNDALIPEFASAFAFDFDFQREIRPGDVFEAAWEQTVNDRGEAIGAKRLVYASLTTAEKSKALYRYTPPGEQEPGWFDGAGRSIRRSLMRTPVEGARISSQFGYRTHPILGYTKLHKGTDFAAPTGTPIYAAGDGVIQVAAPRGAAGNFISLQHDNGWRTTYMHLNTFAPVSVAGARVTQGTEIGQVGTTGRSTGPHLHFEVYIDGEPVDSMTIQVEQGRALAGDAMKGFEKERDRIDALRASSF
jgi:murein DD-endopeptidase MepM/ murein hydrolase activator NlpD